MTANSYNDPVASLTSRNLIVKYCQLENCQTPIFSFFDSTNVNTKVMRPCIPSLLVFSGWHYILCCFILRIFIVAVVNKAIFVAVENVC